MKKTTLLKCIAGLHVIFAVIIMLFGDDSAKSEVIFWGSLIIYWVTTLGSDVLKAIGCDK